MFGGNTSGDGPARCRLVAINRLENALGCMKVPMFLRVWVDLPLGYMVVAVVIGLHRPYQCTFIINHPVRCTDSSYALYCAYLTQ